MFSLFCLVLYCRNEFLERNGFISWLVTVKIAKQNGAFPQENQHLANQVRLQLPSDEVNDQTIAMTVIEAMPHYDQLL